MSARVDGHLRPFLKASLMIPTISAALSERGYTTLTDVQEAVLNPDYEGKDLLVSARTGSGKTVGLASLSHPTFWTVTDLLVAQASLSR